MVVVHDKRKRFSTYRKQKERLKKMVYELATLCSVDVGVISISPSGRTDAWPEHPHELLRVFRRCAELWESDEGRCSPGMTAAEGGPSTSSSSPLPPPPSPPCPVRELLGMNAAMLEYVDKRIRLLTAGKTRAERSENSAAREVSRGRAVAGRLTAPRSTSYNLVNGGMVAAGFGRRRNSCGLEAARNCVQRLEGSPLMAPRVV